MAPVTTLPFALSEARTSILESMNLMTLQHLLFLDGTSMWKFPFMCESILFRHHKKHYWNTFPRFSETNAIHFNWFHPSGPTKRSVRKVLTLFEHVEEDPMSSSLMSRMKSQWCQWAGDGMMGCLCCWLKQVRFLGKDVFFLKKVENWSDFFVVLLFLCLNCI